MSRERYLLVLLMLIVLLSFNIAFSWRDSNFPEQEEFSKKFIVPITFVIVRDGNLINFRKNIIARYFFFRLVSKMNYIIRNLDTIGEDSSCLYNDWLGAASTLKAPSKLPIIFKFREIVVIKDSFLGDASNFNSCGMALHDTYRQRVISKIPNYDSASIYVFVTGSSCWERKISEVTLPTDCKGKYNNGTSYRMCAMGPPAIPIALHVMVGALRLHYQHNKPSFRRMAGSLLHEIFHWAGLGHTKCPNGIMNPSGKAKRRFLNSKEQETIIKTMRSNPAWRLITQP
ncbi:MAG: hypothetical protein GXO48_05580 [Chlorobi bacterium]|nr:hypothetical protein [Chlorobiota bacterium]